MSHDNTSAPRFVRLALTAEQRSQVRAATGREAESIELGMRELEERIAPISFTQTMSKSSPK